MTKEKVPTTTGQMADVIAAEMGCRIAVCDPADCACFRAARRLLRLFEPKRRETHPSRITVWRGEKDAEFMRLFEAGDSYTIMGRKLGVTRNAILMRIRRLNLRRR
jgi:hypothetical protein